MITKLEGQAWIRDADGNLQPLRVGMRIPVDAEIITAAGAQLSLQGSESGVLQVAENQQLKLADDLFKTADPAESALANPADTDVNALITALNQGQDPLAQLDPTAATLAGGDGAGSTYVRLSSVIENTTPLALEYPRSVATPTADVISGGVIAPEEPAPQAGVGGDAKSVYEAGLNQEASSETTSGSIAISASDGISSITIGGVSFTLAQLLGDVGLLPSVNTGEGTLRITGYTPGANNQAGTVSYEYTLNAAQQHAPGANNNTLPDTVGITVLGAGGSTAGGSINITIVDDVPVATAINAGVVTEDSATTVVDGNVKTATGNSFGADGQAVLDADAVTWGSVNAVLNGGAAVNLSNYGALVRNADGSWSFTLDNSKPATQALNAGDTIAVTLGYSLTDKDSDTRSSTISFNIQGADDTARVTVNAGDDNDFVYEAGLTSAATTESTTGVITVQASDGVAKVTIGGVEYTVAQLGGNLAALGTVNTDEGTLTITSFSLAGDGKSADIGYSYTLNAAQQHAPGANNNTLPDTVGITVLGAGGSTAGGSIN
ncbi:retention module-containing protein, partial [Comamonas sp. CAH-2]|uniref:retention module-containing protein n=1 Tax=Comamonas sp. CAH-2 TaxID=2605745 RepID=UPI00139685C8